MTSINIEQVTDLHHWSDKTFSFKTTRKFLNEFHRPDCHLKISKKIDTKLEN